MIDMVRGGVKKEAFDGKKVLDGQNKRRNSATGMGIKLKNSATVLGIKLGKALPDSIFACRHEMKYRISESKAVAIAQFIKPYLPVDRYSQLRPKGEYPIVSTYLDTKDFKLYRETLSGTKNRFKLRIRSYSDELDSPCFFEIKRRLNNIVIKNRVRVQQNDIESILSGMHLPPQKYKTDEQILKQFQLYMNYIKARPVVKIRYMRQAYEGDSDNRVRVTFDRKLSYNVTGLSDVSMNDQGWHSTGVGRVILEIKFTARYPAWLNQMVKCFDLQRQSMSKYATSIKRSFLHGLNAPEILAYNYG